LNEVITFLIFLKLYEFCRKKKPMKSKSRDSNAKRNRYLQGINVTHLSKRTCSDVFRTVKSSSTQLSSTYRCCLFHIDPTNLQAGSTVEANCQVKLTPAKRRINVQFVSVNELSASYIHHLLTDWDGSR